jgi:hypothetical protein
LAISGHFQGVSLAHIRLENVCFSTETMGGRENPAKGHWVSLALLLFNAADVHGWAHTRANNFAKSIAETHAGPAVK